MAIVFTWVCRSKKRRVTLKLCLSHSIHCTAHIPGQSCVLQSCISSCGPTHGSPPYRAGIKALRRDLVPLSQVLLHSFQFDQGSHTQGSERESVASEWCMPVGICGLLTRAIPQEAASCLRLISRAVSPSVGRSRVVTFPFPGLCSIVTTRATVCPLCPRTPASMSCRGSRKKSHHCHATPVPPFLTQLLPRTHLDSCVCCMPLPPSALPRMDLLRTSPSLSPSS